MKNVLVTGGAGFIGRSMVRLLLDEGLSVTVIDNLSTGTLNNVELFRDDARYKFVYDTIENIAVLDRLASETDYIVHLAAAVGVRTIIENPVETIHMNVSCSELVLKACLRYRIPVIITSTSEVYGKGVSVPFAENDDVLLGPTNKSRWAYAASKMLDEFMAMAYFKQYSVPIRIVRLFNSVGAGQLGRYGMVLPRFVYYALNNLNIPVYGTGKQSRCFCDVRDTVRGIWKTMTTANTAGRIYNIGSDREISMEDLASMVRDRTGSASKIVYVPYSSVYSADFEDMDRRVPSLVRTHEELKWIPEHTLEETIDLVSDFVRDNNMKEHYTW